MAVTIYAGRAGDRNQRGMRGAALLGSAIGSRFGVGTRTIGAPMPVVEGGWADQLRAAAPDLRLLAAQLTRCFEEQGRAITVMGRCAASLATLPVVAARYPNAAIVWFDAHGDCNTPGHGCGGDMGYLGGMVISGAAGEWQTGLGAGIELSNVVLVGARDLDPPERKRVETGEVTLVGVGAALGERLAQAIAGRQTYVHLDCDVLDAGLLATEYQSPGGLSFEVLSDAFGILAEHDVLGIEITEYEDCWPDGEPNRTDQLIASIEAVLQVCAASRSDVVTR